MNRASEDSKKYDIVCMSFGKEKQKGIKVVKAGKKDSFLEQTMEIKTQNCKAEDILNIEQIKILLDNRKNRKNQKNNITER